MKFPIAHAAYYGKRDADAEPEADAALLYGGLGYGYSGLGYAGLYNSAYTYGAYPYAATYAAAPYAYGYNYGYAAPIAHAAYYGKRSADAEPGYGYSRGYGYGRSYGGYRYGKREAEPARY